MNNRFRWFSTSALVAFLVLILLPLGVTALALTPESISKSKTSSEYELSSAKDTTEITLALPSEEYLDTFDIVFVVDSSNESQLWEPEAVELMNALLDEDLNVNIGVVKFKGRAQDTIDAVSSGSFSKLTALSDESRPYIEEAINFNPDTDSRSTCGNGTNIHSALLLAQDWLEESDTPDDHKYVLLFTDGRSYIFDDGNGNPTAIYAQYHRSGVTPTRLQGSGRPTINSQAQADKYHATISQGAYSLKDESLQNAFDSAVVRFGTTAHSAEDFDLLYNSSNAELTGTSPYETYCLYPDSGTAKVSWLGDGNPATVHENVSEWSTYFKSGATLFNNYYEPSGVGEGVPYLELNPLKIVYDEETNAYSYTGELNPNYWMFHVSSEEKALYLTAHTWTDLGENYHTIAIPNDRGYNAGLETCADFLRWLPEHSELSAPVKDTAAVEALFDQLENQLIYVVGKAVVTDEVPSYLDLVEDNYSGIPFQVTVDDEALDAAAIGGNAWGFGTPVDGTYPYEVVWDADSRTFTFYINVPVENAHPVKLNYVLQWNGTGEEDVDVDTNASTTIQYWSSSNTDPNPEQPDGTEDYVSPVVIYRSTVDYTVTKVWDDGSDADGIRPSSVSVQLYANGDPSGNPVNLDASHGWTYTWEGLLLKDDGEVIDYEVQEVSVPQDYTAKVEENDDGCEATITNSHTPASAPNPPDSGGSNLPGTGDRIEMVYFLLAAFGAGLLLILVSFALRKRVRRAIGKHAA